MIEPFYGTYLFHPAALEYSGNTCSHNCFYCFANINKSARYAKLSTAINQLHKDKCATYADILLSEGFPICISNRSNPFSMTNYRDTIALFRHLADRENGIFIQTKGGTGIDEVLEIIGDRRNIVWYITITTLDDSITARIEPHAPTSTERLALAKRLHDLGFLVLIAVNPCNEAWMSLSDLQRLTGIMKEIGINHICLEILNLKPKIINAFTDRQREQAGARVLETCNTPANKAYTRTCTEYLISTGLHVCKKGMPFRSEFFTEIKNRLGKTFPVLQEFVNWCFDQEHDNGRIFTFKDFLGVMARDELFLRRFAKNDLRAYLLRADFKTWKANRIIQSHEQLLRLNWNSNRLKTGIQNHSLFKVVQENGRDKFDAEGNKLLYFNGRPQIKADAPKGGDDDDEEI